VFDEDFVLLRSPGERLRVRTSRVGVRPSAAQRVADSRAASLFRFKLEARDTNALDAAQRLLSILDGQGTSAFRRLSSTASSSVFIADLARRITTEFERGRLTAEFEVPQFVTSDEEGPEAELPPLPPRRPEGRETFFDVRYVDEIGQAINGLEVEFLVAGEPQSVTTNAAGVALLEGVVANSATVSVPNVEELEDIVEPRWEKLREGTLAVESNTVEVLFTGGDLPVVSLRAALPHRVVVKPPLGRLFVELFDRTGRVRHAETDYEVSGPMSFSGTTDSNGRLVHDPVLPGDYKLSFEVEVDLGQGPVVQKLETQLVVLRSGDPAPEVRMLGALPRVTLARLKGMFFETNKSFLLPASTAVFDRLRQIYADNDPSELLVVGHTDTTGEPSVNDPLSLERADNTAAFLKDDVDAWLAMYETSVPEKRRWGSDEDQAMVFSMADFATRPPDEEPIRWFQRTRSLKIDGIAGPETRRQLITEYMALDGISLGGAEPAFDIEITTHGCGENFPLDETGEELDAAPADGREDQVDRRVELLFFDKEFGIVPPAPGKNSPKGSSQYPEWRKRAERTLELETNQPETVEIRLHDHDAKPIPRATCEARVAGVNFGLSQADADGFVRFLLPPVCPSRIELSYGPEGSVGPFPFFCELVVDCDSGSDIDRDRQRLHNLGYLLEWEFETQAIRFQEDYAVDHEPEPVGVLDGALPAASRELLARIFEGDCDASLPV
jgi:hypothetical protein